MSLSSTEIREWLKDWRHTKSPWGEKLDRNGYAESIMGESECCYRCAKILPPEEMARHEVYMGNPNRKTSKACGFWISVCPDCHEMYHSDKELRKQLARDCQQKFELSHTREEFMELIGRSYL